MILLLHPHAASARSRRFPLSILALAAVLEGREDYAIIDGNVDPYPGETLERIHLRTPAELIAVSVMPGPQMVAAIPLCREFRAKFPTVPIVWGGYFPSIYPDTALNAPYVDYVVRSQGEDAFWELLTALRQGTGFDKILGLSYKDREGRHIHNAVRPLRSPGDFPWFPYHRLDAAKYILPTFLGSRTAVHHSSIGCPFRCAFCGVASVFNGEKMESPERTAAILRFLKTQYSVNAIQFYDSNFFLLEDHARDLAYRLIPLELRWWCQARISTIQEYSDQTLSALKRAGVAMIYCGAESGSDWALKQMDKKLTSEQTLAFAERIRRFGIIPEFSFVTGNPQDPERDIYETIALIRKLKRLNPAAEIIVQHYVPTPQQDGMYGGVDGQIQFPTTPEEWATDRWYRFTLRKDPQLPWLSPSVKHQIEDFRFVVNSRWPTVQNIRMPAWGRTLLQLLSSWRYTSGIYAFPVELRLVQKAIGLRNAATESL